MIISTTPKVITPAILALCKKIDATQSPLLVPVKPGDGAIVNDCYPNVESHIKKFGGSVQHGWIIWESPDVIIEGNFHACWRDGAGNLIDITPKDDGETEILFLPDSKKIYEGIPIDNVREILTKDPHLRTQFMMQQVMNKLHAKYTTDGRNSEIPKEELAKELAKIGIHPPNDSGPVSRSRIKVGRNDRCPCNSGLKYKNCCGK